jgi:prepilin-type N-terminal cleavage/methylation domain-containing protein
MTHARPDHRVARERGFTLVEMIVVVFLLALAMLGILAVFDASARVNKSEQDVADAQGAVRYGVYQMTRAIRMAGSGGLFVTQAILNAPDPQLAGVTLPSGTYDDVPNGTKVTSLSGDRDVRPGTDMIEVRGVLNSPLVAFAPPGFGGGDGCGTCDGSAANLSVIGGGDTGGGFEARARALGGNPGSLHQGGIYPVIDAFTAGASSSAPMMVLVASTANIHTGCSDPLSGARAYIQPLYNVGMVTAPTQLVSSSSFGSIDFTNAVATEFNNENPADPGIAPAPLLNAARAGILEDLIFFIDNSDPNHPALAQGTRRGGAFDVVTLADDVEDMQISYGVDRNGDNRVTRILATSPTDTDRNVSNQVNGDEWAPNVPGESPWTTIQFQSDPAPGNFQHTGSPPAAHCPRLHGVMIALVAKARDPDPTYKAPVALGYRAMNSPVTVNAPYPDTAQYPGLPGQPQFRRRVQMLRINLRNYAYESN